MPRKIAREPTSEPNRSVKLWVSPDMFIEVVNDALKRGWTVPQVIRGRIERGSRSRWLANSTSNA